MLTNPIAKSAYWSVWPAAELQPGNYVPFDIARAGINLLSASLVAFDLEVEEHLNIVPGFAASQETSFPRHTQAHDSACSKIAILIAQNHMNLPQNGRMAGVLRLLLSRTGASIAAQ